VLVRRELPGDVAGIRAVHVAAFGDSGEPARVPVEAGLVDALRASGAWVPELSLVADRAGEIVGHVACSRASIGAHRALGLGPLGVLPRYHGTGVGSALMHAVLGAADALGEPVVVLLGHARYYPRFGFRPAREYGITPPVAEWGEEHFQARVLTAWEPGMRGAFEYAAPFRDL
jgi:putative acetyltransferase